MVSITSFDEWIIIAKKILWNGSAADDAYISLASHQGEDMCYDAAQKVIDYPGEYDISDCFIKAWADKKGLMNYTIRLANGKNVVIAQTKKYLGMDDMPESVENWLLADVKVYKQWASLELEGDVLLLDGSEIPQE